MARLVASTETTVATRGAGAGIATREGTTLLAAGALAGGMRPKVPPTASALALEPRDRRPRGITSNAATVIGATVEAVSTARAGSALRAAVHVGWGVAAAAFLHIIVHPEISGASATGGALGVPRLAGDPIRVAVAARTPRPAHAGATGGEGATVDDQLLLGHGLRVLSLRMVCRLPVAVNQGTGTDQQQDSGRGNENLGHCVEN